MMMIKTFNYKQERWEDVAASAIIAQVGFKSHRMIELADGTWLNSTGDGTQCDDNENWYGIVYRYASDPAQTQDDEDVEIVEFLGYVKL